MKSNLSQGYFTNFKIRIFDLLEQMKDIMLFFFIYFR